MTQEQRLSAVVLSRAKIDNARAMIQGMNRFTDHVSIDIAAGMAPGWFNNVYTRSGIRSGVRPGTVSRLARAFTAISGGRIQFAPEDFTEPRYPAGPGRDNAQHAANMTADGMD